MALSSHSTTNEIIARATIDYDESVRGQLPGIRNLKQTIRRARATESNFPRPPTSLSIVFEIPDSLKVTLSGSDFLLYDNQTPGDRLLIFSTSRSLSLLRTQSSWFCDGTFRTCPLIFEQLYTIHVAVNDGVVPVAYVLLPNRTTSTYNKMWECLKTLKPQVLQPARIIVDFEKAAISSIRKQFPNTTIRGCYFHLSQSVWRKIQSLPDTLEIYKRDAMFNLHIKMIIALAFVPENDVELGFVFLTTLPFCLENLPCLEDIFNYFEDNYIGRFVEGQGRRPAAFPISTWNVFESTATDAARTNNAVEGWHSGFAKLVNCSHPSIFKFIEYLQLDESYQLLASEQRLRGLPVSSKKSKYVAIHTRLRQAVQQYNIINLIDYIKTIALMITI